MEDLPAFELCRQAEAEAGAGVRPVRATFSASQLAAFTECKRKWFYRYVCNAVEERASAASAYGLAFHQALEDFHQRYPRPGEIEPQELLTKLEGYLNAQFDREREGFESPVERELQRRRALRTARKYVHWLVAEAACAPYTVLGCELRVEMQLQGFDFVGFIDRLDREDRTGAVTVLDYKTGSIARTAAEYRENVRSLRDFQLPFYYWARTEAGDRVTRLALVPLKDALLDVEPVSLEVTAVPVTALDRRTAAGTISIGELERARARMIEICEELTSGRISRFAETSDARACEYCDYAAACRQRPAPLADRFAR